MPTLIAERGGDSPVVGMKPLTCPGCHGRRTTFSITPSRPQSPSLRPEPEFLTPRRTGHH